MIVIALFWSRATAGARLWMLGLGGSFALLAGALRIVTGRHFLSDVAFAFLISALVLAILHRALGLGTRQGLTPSGLRSDARALLGRQRS